MSNRLFNVTVELAAIFRFVNVDCTAPEEGVPSPPGAGAMPPPRNICETPTSKFVGLALNGL
jgi:hypothetical protein